MHPSTSHALFGESDSEITQVTEHFLSFRTHARAPAGFATLSEGAIWRLKLLKEVARNFELGFPGTYVYFVRFVVQGRLHAVSQYFNTREKLLSKHFGMEHHLMESLALRVSSRRRPEMGPISCPTLLPSFPPHFSLSSLLSYTWSYESLTHSKRQCEQCEVCSLCCARETSLLPPERFMPASEGLATRCENFDWGSPKAEEILAAPSNTSSNTIFNGTSGIKR